jgi:hypothetical protein
MESIPVGGERQVQALRMGEMGAEEDEEAVGFFGWVVRRRAMR